MGVYLLVNDDSKVLDKTKADSEDTAHNYFRTLKGWVGGSIISEEDYKNDLELTRFEAQSEQ